MGAFVTIHGIDGTGKTTIAQRLPDALRYEFPEAYYFDDLRLPEQVTPLVAPVNAYEKSVQKKIGQSSALGTILQKGGLVAKDRWMIDVAASNSFSDGEDYTTNPNGVLIPSLSVLFTCAEDERMRRIHARGNPTPDDLVPNEPGTRAHYFETFLREHLPDFSMSSLVIDTTPGDPTAVIEEIREAVVHVTRV
jgi:thymidylate kinase